MINYVSAVAVALAITSGVAHAETTPAEKTLGELMAVMVMSERCHVQLGADVMAQIDAEGPRIQKAAGIKEEEMSEIAKQLNEGLTDGDCPAITNNLQKIAANALNSAKKIP